MAKSRHLRMDHGGGIFPNFGIEWRSLTHACCERTKLSVRNQLIALAQCADPEVVSLWIITNRGRINPCTAARAKCLRADRSAVGCFPIHSWFARQQHERAWPRDNNCSQWSTAHRLTIGAVADSRRFRIGFSFKRHVATVTTPIDFHDTGFRALPRRCPVNSATVSVLFLHTGR